MTTDPTQNLNRLSQRRKLLKIVAGIQSVYALIETSDCVTAILMAMGLVANPYPKMLFGEIQNMFDHQAIWVVPLFLFYTTLRITSAIGLWKNRLWGFWLTIFVSCATLIMAPFLLPFTSAEMLLNGILIILLFMVMFGRKEILPDA